MSGNQHELFMMALTAVLSIIVSFFAGRIWEAWHASNEDAELSREEIALITAGQMRRQREHRPGSLRFLAEAALDSGFQSRRRTASER